MTSKEVTLIREGLSLTKAEFARLLGVDERTIYRWEAGEKRPTGPALAILRVLVVLRDDAAARGLIREVLDRSGGLTLLLATLFARATR